jgi:hypothetical protein
VKDPTITDPARRAIGPLLYLDLDGILHAGRIRYAKGALELDSGSPPFVFAEAFSDLLDAYPTTELVLTDSWLVYMGPDEINHVLPRRLASQIATCACTLSSLYPPRGGSSDPRSCIDHARFHRASSWLVLHSGAFGVPSRHSSHFLQFDPTLGLGCRRSRLALRAWLWTHSRGG